MSLPAMEPFPLLDISAWVRPPPPRRLSARRICNAVARLFGLTFKALRSRCRDVKHCEARHLACYLVRKLTGMSYPQIGRALRRDHSTVMFACRSVSAKMASDPGGRTAIAVAQAEGALA
jgi:chromosomal replication initiator protein